MSMPCQFFFAYFPPTLLHCAENILPQQGKKKKSYCERKTGRSCISLSLAQFLPYTESLKGHKVDSIREKKKSPKYFELLLEIIYRSEFFPSGLFPEILLT